MFQYKEQILLVAVGIFLIAGLYFFGHRITPSESAADSEASMAGNGSMPAINIEDIQAPKSRISLAKLTAKLKSSVNTSSLDSINYWENQFLSNEQLPIKVEALSNLAQLWEGQQYLEVAAEHYYRIAQLDSTKENWEKSGDKLAAGFQISSDSTMRQHLLESAIWSYHNAYQFDSSQLDTKVKLASCFLDGYPNKINKVMQGVFLLREVTQTDSNHIQANLSLGKMSIVSGQFDKAVARFKTVIRVDSTSTEGHYYLGEAYLGLGEKEKAIESLKNCKKLIKNPIFAAELENYINRILKS